MGGVSSKDYYIEKAPPIKDTVHIEKEDLCDQLLSLFGHAVFVAFACVMYSEIAGFAGLTINVFTKTFEQLPLNEAMKIFAMGGVINTPCLMLLNQQYGTPSTTVKVRGETTEKRWVRESDGTIDHIERQTQFVEKTHFQLLSLSDKKISLAKKVRFVFLFMLSQQAAVLAACYRENTSYFAAFQFIIGAAAIMLLSVTRLCFEKRAGMVATNDRKLFSEGREKSAELSRAKQLRHF